MMVCIPPMAARSAKDVSQHWAIGIADTAAGTIVPPGWRSGGSSSVQAKAGS